MSDNRKYIQAQKFKLAGSGISATDTSITLKSFMTPNSETIAMSDVGTLGVGTLGPGTSREEIITFTGVTQNADGTATLTGVTRGCDFRSPYTQDTALRKSHSGNETFILSNNPQFYDSFANKENDETINGLYTFTQLPKSNGGDATDSDQLITYAQALALATGTASINRVVVAGTAGETLVAGNLVYIKIADGRWWKCDADTAATVDNIIMGIAQGAGTAGNAVTNGVLLFGLDSNQTGLTTNTAYYASNTAGGISSTVGTVEVSVGISQSTTSIIFYPRYNQQLTEDQQDAMVGTAGTPSATNKFVTNDDTTGTGLVQRASQLANYTNAKNTFIAGATITAGQALHVSQYSQSDGGITLDVQTATAYASTTNQTMSFTVANNSNRCLLVAVDATSAPSGVTYNGVSMTLIDSQTYSGAIGLFVYRLVAPTTGTNNISVTGTGIRGISGASYYNVDQTTPVNASAKGSSSAGTKTLAITTISQGDFIHSFYAQGGFTGVSSVTTTISGKYVSGSAATVVSVTASSNPFLSTSTIGKVNEVQAISLVSTSTGGSGFPVEAMLNIALKPATAVSIGVVPTNSSAIVLNEPLIDFIGFADSSVSTGASISTTYNGIASGLSGLTPGATYYLQNSAGTIGTTRGTYGKVIGKALSATTLAISTNKTLGAAITKATTYTYYAECDGTVTVRGANTIITDSITYTGVASATMSIPVSKGKTYVISGGTDTYFIPLA